MVGIPSARGRMFEPEIDRVIMWVEQTIDVLDLNAPKIQEALEQQIKLVEHDYDQEPIISNAANEHAG
jgi:hypothetical protein